MRIRLLSILFSIFFIASIYPQRAYPLKIGNTWIYNSYPGTTQYTVVDDSVMVDSIYYYEILIQHDNNYVGFSRHCRRVDDFYRRRLWGGWREGEEEI